uniref:Uncharacterized protein n=1 Tax=Branchiostoma floridae TaxID=7739 RepID=C3YCA5_BRAFL|eukprot:XP_002606127.1 hypothetical protein BRAFLDRAFT_88038 [Branchiostoma floridae]
MPVLLVMLCILFLSLFVCFVYAKRRPNNHGTEAISSDHTRAVPNVSLPGMVRSGSLPDLRRTHREVPVDAVSRRSLPADLHSIEPTYSEIPDHVAAAQRPLPETPHTYWQIQDHLASAQRPLPPIPCTYDEIPDDFVDQIRRHSLPAISQTDEVVNNTSCMSESAALHSSESTYCYISDDDDDNDNIIDNDKDNDDDIDGPILPYAAVAKPLLIEATKVGENSQTYTQNSAPVCQSDRSREVGENLQTYTQNSAPACQSYRSREVGENLQTYTQNSAPACQSDRSTEGRHVVAYGLERKTHPVTFYEDCHCAQAERANVASRIIFEDDAAAQAARAQPRVNHVLSPRNARAATHDAAALAAT